MKEYIHLGIKNPCPVDLETFKKTAKGSFCDVCSKEVIDFTKMNTQQTLDYLTNQGNKNICGKFSSTQLTTYEVPKPASKRIGFIAGVGLSLLSLLSITTANAQEKKKTENTEGNNDSKVINSIPEKKLTVSGNVSDETGPLPGCAVALQGTKISVTTDFDGNFNFPQPLKKGDVLVFSYIGYESKKVEIIDEKSALKINLQVNMKQCDEEIIIIAGEVAIQKVFKSKN